MESHRYFNDNKGKGNTAGAQAYIFGKEKTYARLLSLAKHLYEYSDTCKKQPEGKSILLGLQHAQISFEKRKLDPQNRIHLLGRSRVNSGRIEIYYEDDSIFEFYAISVRLVHEALHLMYPKTSYREEEAWIRIKGFEFIDEITTSEIKIGTNLVLGANLNIEPSCLPDFIEFVLTKTTLPRRQQNASFYARDDETYREILRSIFCGPGTDYDHWKKGTLDKYLKDLNY